MTDRLMAEIATDIEQLHNAGRITRAEELSTATGVKFNNATYPLYFTGDLNARVVLVHLNPAQDNQPDGATLAHRAFTDVKDYIDRHAHFGELTYGPTRAGGHPTRFDAKQVEFLLPFAVIDFVDPPTSSDDRFANLAKVVDRKLQLELVPYGSRTFPTSHLLRRQDLLQPHMDRVLATIAAAPRDFVIFCGSAFDPLLAPYASNPTEWFHLTKKDGTPEALRSRCTRLELPLGDQLIPAMLASSFARQGIPMRAYGQEVARRYAGAASTPAVASSRNDATGEVHWVTGVFGDATIIDASRRRRRIDFGAIGITPNGRVLFSPAEGLAYSVGRGQRLVDLHIRHLDTDGTA